MCRCKSAGTHPGPHPGGQCDIDLGAIPNGGDVAGMSRQTVRLPVEGLTLPLLPPGSTSGRAWQKSRLGVTITFDPKPKVWRDTAPQSAAGGSETFEFRTGMEQAHYRPVRQVCSQKRISDRARQLSEPLSCSNSDALISRLREVFVKR